MQTALNTIPTGLYVLVKDKGETLARVEELGAELVGNYNYWEAVLRWKKVLHETIEFLKEFFRPETHGIDSSLRMLKSMNTDNALQARNNVQWMLGFLTNLKMLITTAITVNDLPSCRSLLADPKEIAASKATDMIKSNVIKSGVLAMHLVKDVHDLVTIADIDGFYRNGIQEFENEKNAGWSLSPVEQVLENIFHIEREYCEMATLHVAGKLTEDLFNAKKAVIDEYQNRLAQSNLSAQQQTVVSIQNGRLK